MGWYLAAFFLFLGPLAIGLIYVALGNPHPGLNPNLTKGSVLITILAHFCINISMTTIVDRLRLMPSANFFQMTVGPLLILCLVLIVIFFGPKYFSRKSISELPFQHK